jgi:hypothetical protein
MATMPVMPVVGDASDRDQGAGHDHGQDHDPIGAPSGGFPLETEYDRRFGQIEEWMILADRRLERLDAKIDRLGATIDQLNTQLQTVLVDMPTRSGINLYLVGGLVGGLAVGLAIMGVTIGGFVGGLSSLKPEPAQQPSAPSYAAPQAPIIIQMPAGATAGPSAPVAVPAPMATGNH